VRRALASHHGNQQVSWGAPALAAAAEAAVAGAMAERAKEGKEEEDEEGGGTAVVQNDDDDTGPPFLTLELLLEHLPSLPPLPPATAPPWRLAAWTLAQARLDVATAGLRLNASIGEHHKEVAKLQREVGSDK
jgi:hypothetical protein